MFLSRHLKKEERKNGTLITLKEENQTRTTTKTQHWRAGQWETAYLAHMGPDPASTTQEEERGRWGERRKERKKGEQTIDLSKETQAGRVRQHPGLGRHALSNSSLTKHTDRHHEAHGCLNSLGR